MFCDRDIDLWLESGITNSPPNSDRTHDISDAVVLVGLNPVSKPISGYATDSIVTKIGQVILKLTSAIASLIDSTGQRLCQSGFGQVFFGSTLPSGWLWCDGSSYSTTAYPTLFAAIGYTYGGGGGSFNVPDMRGQVPVGLDNIGGSDAAVLKKVAGVTNTFTTQRLTLGGKVGECMHTQTINELVSHNHLQIYGVGTTTSGSPENNPNGRSFAQTPVTNTGGSQPANVVQPGTMCNYIIKI